MKLDVTGLRISLKTWLLYSLEERWVLCHLPVETEEEREVFSSYLALLTRRYLGEELARTPSPTGRSWEDRDHVPESVKAKSTEAGQPVSAEEWARWNLYERYALYKTSVSKNEPEQFNAALREFRVRESD
jgi:hypothetical protein